jgi:cytidine deaminase
MTKEDTPADLKRLLRSARKAARSSYSPYSAFPVGAAVLGADGRTYSGCNVENASYGLTICAERNAIVRAVAAGNRRIAAIAVTCVKGDAKQPDTLMPCGACRQVMVEFMDRDAPVLVDGVRTFTLSQLLPRAFRIRSRAK